MIVAFTGAGISKESGISTFQEKPNVRDKLTRTYASRHPEKYRALMREFVNEMSDKKPNDAHIALAEYDIPIITMNIDDLHEKAGSKHIIKIYGRLPNKKELDHCEKLYGVPVLYGDPAPGYSEALNIIELMDKEDLLLIIGASNYTRFSTEIRTLARLYGINIVDIQENAAKNTRKVIETYSKFLEDYNVFIKNGKKKYGFD